MFFDKQIFKERRILLIKKIIGILCAITVITASFSVVSAEDAAATISAGTVVVDKGIENVTVSLPIMFKGNVTLTAFDVEISFDESIKFTKYISGNVLTATAEPVVGINPVIIPFYDLYGIEAKDGTYATLELSVPTTKAKDYPITVTVGCAMNEEYIDIDDKITAVSGVISVVGDSTDEEIENEPEQVPDVKPDEEPIIQDGLTSAERKKDVICLKVGKSLTVTYNKKISIDDKNPLVVPYISNERTMVPLRYISEALGAEVLWEAGWNGCIVKRGEKEIKFEFGSAEFTVNGEKYTYEAPIEMLHDRTMVPVRFISEHLDCDVYWEPINSAVIITPVDNPWKPERQAEITATNEMLLTILNII